MQVQVSFFIFPELNWDFVPNLKFGYIKWSKFGISTVYTMRLQRFRNFKKWVLQKLNSFSYKYIILMLYLVYYEYSREMVGGGVSSTLQVQSRQRCLVLWCYALGDVHIRTGIHSFILLFILSFFIFFASFFYSSSYLISHNLVVFYF